MTTQQQRATPARRPMTDADLNQLRYSPVCTYCAHWQAGDGMHCAGAYPRGGPAIPGAIWSGQPGEASCWFHTLPFPNAEHPTDHGVQFEPVAGAKLPAKLRAAYQAALAAKKQKGG